MLCCCFENVSLTILEKKSKNTEGSDTNWKGSFGYTPSTICPPFPNVSNVSGLVGLATSILWQGKKMEKVVEGWLEIVRKVRGEVSGKQQHENNLLRETRYGNIIIITFTFCHRVLPYSLDTYSPHVSLITG